jgi:hypothetical protein
MDFPLPLTLVLMMEDERARAARGLASVAPHERAEQDEAPRNGSGVFLAHGTTSDGRRAAHVA